MLLVQMKNWLPFVFGPELAMLKTWTGTQRMSQFLHAFRTLCRWARAQPSRMWASQQNTRSCT